MIDLKCENNGLLFKNLVAIIEKNMGKIPMHGVIAGQAVASALFEHFGISNQPLPYNDVDVFVCNGDAPYCYEIDNNEASYDKEGRLITHEEKASKIFFSNGVEKPSGLYTSHNCALFDPKEVSGYKIVYSYRDEVNANVNFVRIELRHNNKKPLMAGRALQILEGFDINACEIALDTHLEKVVWTPAFQDFLYSKTLRATYLGTPMHTAVRLSKKAKELDFSSLNMEEEMTRLQSMRAVYITLENLRGKRSENTKLSFLPGNLFSAAYLSKFKKEKEELSPYFSLNEKTCEFNKSYHATDSNNKRACYNEVFERKMYTLDPKSSNKAIVDSFLDAYYGISPLHNNERFGYEVETAARLFLLWYQLSTGKKNREALKKLVQSLGPKRNKLSQWLIKLHLSDSLHTVKNTSIKKLITAHKSYDRHETLLINWAIADLSVKNIVNWGNEINWLDKNGLHHYIGWLETSSISNKEDPSDLSADSGERYLSRRYISDYSVSLKNPDFRVIVKRLSDEYLEKLKTFHFKSDTDNILKKLSETFPHAHVQQLCSGDGFHKEGSKLKHCVGGYYDEAKERGCMIFSINSDKNSKDMSKRSTLSLNIGHLDRDVEAYTSEHRGVRNKEAHSENEKIELAIKGLVNAQFGLLGQGTNDNNDCIETYNQELKRMRAKTAHVSDPKGEDLDEEIPF